ncbi:hypothetical protein HMPREF1486_05398 [Streptomyces sp. HPH0547]|nr:hypothetical protein HMPREF1486_05398 [Streptomyces sp. HPH0547]
MRAVVRMPAVDRIPTVVRTPAADRPPTVVGKQAVARTSAVARPSAAARTSAAARHGAEHLAAVLTQAVTAHVPLPVAHCAPVRAGSTAPAHMKP